MKNKTCTLDRAIQIGIGYSLTVKKKYEKKKKIFFPAFPNCECCFSISLRYVYSQSAVAARAANRNSPENRKATAERFACLCICERANIYNSNTSLPLFIIIIYHHHHHHHLRINNIHIYVAP